MAGFWSLIALLLVVRPLCVLAVAPTDYHLVCRTDFRYRRAHDWIPYANDTSSGTWRVLIDQYDYENILGEQRVPPGVWSVRDVDGDGLQVAEGGGGTCSYQIRVPSTFKSSSSNNWLFTQAIDYLDAVEVFVNATVRFTTCAQRPDCVNSFVTLHRYDTNSLSETQRINPDNYHPNLGDLASSRLQHDLSHINEDTTIITRFNRPTNFNFTYLGIQDTGTSGNIIRIFLYYKVCPRRVDGLVTYPEAPLPQQQLSSHIIRLAHCAKNAHNTTRRETYTYSDGRCVRNVTCSCNLGYREEISGPSESRCTACDAGEYRSARNSSCVNCPANSTSMEAAEFCVCADGHYRATASEGIGVQCTAPPPPTSECREGTIYDTGATVQWRNPPHCGGRTDCLYRVRINDGPSMDYRPVTFNFNIQETYTIGNLQQDTTYLVTISINNGVSDQDRKNAKLRECSIVFTTTRGSVFMFGNVTYPNNTAIIMENIGEEDRNSLICTTAYDRCCLTAKLGSFYYPNSSRVPAQSLPRQSLYWTRSSGSISLKRKAGNPSPLGNYRCEIPDSTGALQSIFITIGTISETCSGCPSIPTCPTPSESTTCPIPDADEGLFFEVQGTKYLNNTLVLVDEIGEGDSALLCRTNNDVCCSASSPFRGEFYYPNSIRVPTAGALASLYRDRVTNFIRLNRRSNTDVQLGKYRCEILDDNNKKQNLFITIVQNSTQSCPTSTPHTCPALPSTPSCPTCPDCPTTSPPPVVTCPQPLTCPPPPQVPTLNFILDGQAYPNNSVFLMTDIGIGDEALECFTIRDDCCGDPSNRMGEWYYPNMVPVPSSGAGEDFYRDRGSQVVRLNRRNSALSPSGNYRCLIPDVSGITQMLVARIVVDSEGTCTCPPPDPLTVTCPTQPQCATPESATLPPTIITPPTVTCPLPRNCTTPNLLVFRLGYVQYPNNTIVLLEDIGEGVNALFCVSNNTSCCLGSSPFRGKFYYPNNTEVPISSGQHSAYRDRESGSVRLNQRASATQPPLGRYRCEILDDKGDIQWLFINIAQNSSVSRVTTCQPPVDCNECPSVTSIPSTMCPMPQDPDLDSTIDVVAVVDNWIIVNIPVAIAMELDQFNIRIELLSQRQTKEPTIFAVNVDETGQASVITVPSDKLSGVEKDSTYSVKIKPVFKNKTEGKYGTPYEFQFTGAGRDAILSDVSTSEGLVNIEYIAVAIGITFLLTAIAITLLILALVWLCWTCRWKRKCHKNDDSGNNIEFKHQYVLGQ